MNQLAMTLPAETSFAAEDYLLTSSNQPAWNALMRWPNWPDYGYVLYGPAHSGKSHLAAIWAQRAQATRLENPADWQAALEASGAWLIDPLPELSPDTAAALFHLLNHVKSSAGQLLIVCDAPPHELVCTLPDLQSRLRALPTASLSAPDDALLRAVWFKRFADKQLQVSPAVIDYLLQRCERSFEAIHHWVEWLDCAALEQKRAITIPFVKSLLPDDH